MALQLADGRYVVRPGIEQEPNPYPSLAEIRQLDAVVPGIVGHGVNVWLVASHAHITQVLLDQTVSSNPMTARENLDRALKFPSLRKLRNLSTEMTTSDPPVHTRLRAFARQALDRRRVEKAASATGAFAQVLAKSLRSNNTLDAVLDFAAPVAIEMMATLLGIEGEFKNRARGLTTQILQWPDGETAAREIEDGRSELRSRISDLLLAKEAKPGDDLLSDMIRLNEATQQLNHDEMLAMAELFLLAGHDTTASAIGNGLASLERHRYAWNGVTDRSLANSDVVDELLRIDGPVFFQFKCTTRPLALGATLVPGGEVLCLMLGAGNHDPKVFHAPEQIDFNRANRGLAFSVGIHHCLGAALARRVVRESLVVLDEEWGRDHFHVEVDSAVWRRRVRSVAQLPLVLDGA